MSQRDTIFGILQETYEGGDTENTFGYQLNGLLADHIVGVLESEKPNLVDIRNLVWGAWPGGTTAENVAIRIASDLSLDLPWDSR